MSLAENARPPRNWRNKSNSPWTPKTNRRFTELWGGEMTISQISDCLFAEFGVPWSEQSLSWRAKTLDLPHRQGRCGINAIWNDDMIAQLKDLWEKKTRVLTIADLIHKSSGVSFTKSAIIGKAHRLGLPRHAHANRVFVDAVERERARANRRARKADWDRTNRPNRGLLHHYAKRISERALARNVEDYAIPTPQRKTIFELGPHDCRWPVGEPQSDLFFFCGAVAEEKRPYCSSHCQRAYVEIRPR